MTTAVMTPLSRGSIDPRPVDPEKFAGLIKAALDAFGRDVSYAVAIARAASTIRDKRGPITPEDYPADPPTEQRRNRTPAPR